METAWERLKTQALTQDPGAPDSRLCELLCDAIAAGTWAVRPGYNAAVVAERLEQFSPSAAHRRRPTVSWLACGLVTATAHCLHPFFSVHTFSPEEAVEQGSLSLYLQLAQT